LIHHCNFVGLYRQHPFQSDGSDPIFISVQKGSFSALAVSIFGFASRSAKFFYAFAQPLDLLAMTKNPFF
jgi:hypothetical protein